MTPWSSAITRPIGVVSKMLRKRCSLSSRRASLLSVTDEGRAFDEAEHEGERGDERGRVGRFRRDGGRRENRRPEQQRQRRTARAHVPGSWRAMRVVRR